MYRAKALEGLLASRVDLYSFLDAGDEVKSTILHLEDVITRITLQTIECGIFILHYASNTGIFRSRVMDSSVFHFVLFKIAQSRKQSRRRSVRYRASQEPKAAEARAWTPRGVGDSVRVRPMWNRLVRGLFSPCVP
jgi:hypothetical protein